MDKHGSLPEVMMKQKAHISIRSNLAYGQVKKEEEDGGSEYEMCDMPSGAAMATQVPHNKIPLDNI